MKINGTDLLVYNDGVAIAYQKECTINWEQDLPDATSKQSAGYEEHIKGTRRCSCDFSSLFSTDGLSDKDLIKQITDRETILFTVDGGGFLVIGNASLKNVSINAPMEDVAGISGTFIANSSAFVPDATNNLLTNPSINTDYDTFEVSGISITSAIALYSNEQSITNLFPVVSGEIVYVFTILTSNSGELPLCSLFDGSTNTDISTVTAMSNGFSLTALTSLGTTPNGCVRFSNTLEANWSTSDIYIFKL